MHWNVENAIDEEGSDEDLTEELQPSRGSVTSRKLQTAQMSVAVLSSFNYDSFEMPGVDGDAYKAWNEWYQGLEHIFEASNVQESKKFSTMLSYGGKTLRSIYSSINNGMIPKSEDFDVAVNKLEQYFKPKQHATYLRIKFWETEKANDETIDQFVSKLQEKKRHCNFGNTKEEIEDFVMTDKFLTSMPQYIKHELIKDKKLTFESAVRQAKEIESSRNQARELSQPVKEKPFFGGINRLQDRRDQGRRFSDRRQSERRPSDRRFRDRGLPVCYRCNSSSHKADSDRCPAREARCRKCNMVGHFADSVYCRKQYVKRTPQGESEYEPSPKRRKIVVRNVDDDGEEVVCNVNSAGVNVVCQIEGLRVRMLVDSGTNRDIIDERTWKLMLAKGFQPKRQFLKDHVEFIGYGNAKLKQVTAFEANIATTVSGKRYEGTSKFYVIENGSQPLLSKGKKVEI